MFADKRKIFRYRYRKITLLFKMFSAFTPEGSWDGSTGFDHKYCRNRSLLFI